MLERDENYLAQAFKSYYDDGFLAGFVTGVLFTSTVCGLRCLVKYGNR